MENPFFNVKIWLEVTIAGLLYMAAAFFVFQTWFGIHELDLLAHELLPYLAAIVITASFVLGLTLHSLIPRLFRDLLPHELLHWLRSGVPSKVSEDQTLDNVNLALHGSQELLVQMKGIYSNVVLFRLLTPGVFVFGFSLASWCMDTSNARYAPMILLTSSVLSLAFLFLYREYFSRFSKYEVSARKALSAFPKSSQTKSRSPRKEVPSHARTRRSL